MSPERWERIKDVAFSAIERQGEARLRFLEEACGADSDLRRAVEDLLEEHQRPGDSLAGAIGAVAADVPGLGARAGPSMLGQTISHYKIIEKLGQGGMGVVYKAEDVNLERTVALKFLAPHALEDAQSKTRFVREAKASAALDHPNVCTVYEIAEVGGRTFIAMALIGGQTVKEKIAERPVKLEEALDIAIQTAQGLHAAHEKGVVHRDIKPANLMVTEQSQVKIMDFGLAQLADQSRLTKTATFLGTPAYMSPEQAHGALADHRTDIWSLGVVIYEMLTARLPFQGEREQAVLYAIENEEPEPVTALRAGLPIELEFIVGKALAKNRDERYQHVDELLVDLRAAARRWESGTKRNQLVSGARAVGRSQGTSARVAAGWVVAAVTATIAVILAFLLFREGSPSPAGGERQSLKFSVALPAETSLAGEGIATSPDGRHLAFAAVSEGQPLIWVHSFESQTARPLQGTEGAYFPFWSPDSRYIGFFSQGKLKTVDASGGLVRSLCDAPFGAGGAWNPDGLIVFAPNLSGGLHRVSAAGGDPMPVTKLDQVRGELTHRWPSFLPDGQHFLYFAKAKREEDTGVYVAGLEPTDREIAKRVSAENSMATYLAPGYLLFHRGGILTAQRFELHSLQVSGEPIRIGEQLMPSPAFGLAPFSASTNGVLVYRSGAGSTQLTWFDRQGRRLGTVGEPGMIIFPNLSPDQSRLAVGRMTPEQGEDIWIYDLVRGVPQRNTLDPSIDRGPVWSPDGRRIAFRSNRGGDESLYVKSSIGFDEGELLIESADVPWDWSRDGRFIVYNRLDPVSSWDLWVLRTDRQGETQPLVNSRFNENQAQLSPDDRYIAYVSDETGRQEVYLRGFSPTAAASAEREQISVSGGREPRWRQDGKELFYLSTDARLMSVSIDLGASHKSAVPKELFRTQVGDFRGYEVHYVVGARGQRFLVDTPLQDLESLPFTVEVNWLGRLGRAN